jgi:hypothetical protein
MINRLNTLRNINTIGKRVIQPPNIADLGFWWKGEYDGDDLVNTKGANAIYVSGSGLDAIYDFSGLSDVRLDKSNATYWTQPLDSYFYLNLSRPYDYKLQDFQYMRIEGACPSLVNVFFAKGTYSEVTFSTSELLIYSTEQSGNDLTRLFNYIDIKYELASDYGFLPSATASDNVTAWASIPEYSFITVDQAGIYEIDDTLWTESNIVLDFSSGCTIKKTGIPTNYTHTIANEGINDLTRNRNIKIYGNGLIIDQNGINGVSASESYRMRGEINFFRVDKCITEGVSFTNGLNPVFFGHFADINNFRIRNMSIEGEKDGLHFNSKCKDGIVEDIYTDTADDGMAWIVTDFPLIMACVGDINNIMVRRWTDAQAIHTGQSGRVISGSWANWNSGNTYNKTDLCVSSGKIYVKTSAGAQVAANAPTHSSGEVTGADGITWSWLQVGTETEGIINNITIEDSDITISTQMLSNEGSNTDALRSVYPGTEGNAYVDNFVMDNITLNITSDDTILWNSTNFVKNFSIKNLTIDSDYKFYLVQQDSIDVPSVWTEKLTLDGLTVDLSDSLSTLLQKPHNRSKIDAVEVLNSPSINMAGINMLNLRADDRFDLTLTDSVFENILSLILAGTIWDVGIVATDCTFTDVVNVINHTTASPATIDFTSTGCTYTNPTGDYLFNANRVGLTIDVTESVGDIDQDKITDEDVTITKCDLFRVLPVSAMAMVVSDNQMYINVDEVLDGSSVPSTSAFTISDKTIDTVSIDGSFIIITTTTDFSSEDTPTVSYIKPATNYLKTSTDALVDSFADMTVNIWDEDTNNLIEEYDYLDGDSITKDGSDRISKWEGQSVNNYYLEQTGIDSLKPTLTANGVLFDGVSQWLQSINFTLSSSSIVYMVFKQPTWTVNDRILTSGGGILWLFQWGETPKLRANGTTLIANSTLELDTFKTMRLLGDTTNSFMQFDFEEEETGNVSLATTLGFILGSQGSGSLPSNIEVKGIVIRDNADNLDYQIGQMRRLSSRYGLTI